MSTQPDDLLVSSPSGAGDVDGGNSPNVLGDQRCGRFGVAQEPTTVPGITRIQDSALCNLAWDRELDKPTGRSVHIPSGINQKPISYFIPSPLCDLLGRCTQPSHLDDSDLHGEIQAAAFLHLVARRGYAGAQDSRQASLLFDLLWQAPRVETVADVLGLAARVDGRARDIRRQIVFTGSRVASDAVHVYAPHESVPDLLEQLIDGIRSDPSSISVVDRVAVLGFFCVHAHPFRDGNGRWARALALSVERRSLLKTMAAMSFQTMCMQELAENTWPLTRSQGLREYLSLCTTYTDRLLESYLESAAYREMQGIEAALRKAACDATRLKALARGLFVDGRLERDETRRVLGSSGRVVDGLFRSLEDSGLMVVDQVVSMESLWDEITACADTSAALVFPNTRSEKE